MKIALHQGKGTVSSLIKWQSRGKYSHASLLFSDGTQIEAREGKGVRHLPHLTGGTPHEKIDLFEVAITQEQEEQVRWYATEQLGKDYDWTMVLRFISRRQATRKSKGKWFCSELVFAAFQSAGVELFARTEPWEVSPSMLSKSPLLKAV